jgi:Homeodomain-like domain
MSDKEVLRGQIMMQLAEKRLTQQEAADRLSISVRQVKRLKHSYTQEGVDGLITDVTQPLEIAAILHKQSERH